MKCSLQILAPPRPLPPPAEAAEEVEADVVATPPLPAVAADAVWALAAVKIPTTGPRKSNANEVVSDEGSDKAEGEKLSKWAIKKKKADFL